MQGEHDWRCLAEQSEQLYTMLKANDCEVEMLRFPSSPLGGLAKTSRKLSYNRVHDPNFTHTTIAIAAIFGR